MGLQARGATADLWYGYQLVAHLQGWSLDGETVRAKTAEFHRYWYETGGPFTLKLHFGSDRSWVWSDVQVLTLEADCLLRVVGSPTTKG